MTTKALELLKEEEKIWLMAFPHLRTMYLSLLDVGREEEEMRFREAQECLSQTISLIKSIAIKKKKISTLKDVLGEIKDQNDHIQSLMMSYIGSIHALAQKVNGSELGRLPPCFQNVKKGCDVNEVYSSMSLHHSTSPPSSHHPQSSSKSKSTTINNLMKEEEEAPEVKERSGRGGRGRGRGRGRGKRKRTAVTTSVTPPPSSSQTIFSQGSHDPTHSSSSFDIYVLLQRLKHLPPKPIAVTHMGRGVLLRVERRRCNFTSTSTTKGDNMKESGVDIFIMVVHLPFGIAFFPPDKVYFPSLAETDFPTTNSSSTSPTPAINQQKTQQIVANSMSVEREEMVGKMKDMVSMMDKPLDRVHQEYQYRRSVNAFKQQQLQSTTMSSLPSTFHHLASSQPQGVSNSPSLNPSSNGEISSTPTNHHQDPSSSTPTNISSTAMNSTLTTPSTNISLPKNPPYITPDPWLHWCGIDGKKFKSSNIKKKRKPQKRKVGTKGDSDQTPSSSSSSNFEMEEYEFPEPPDVDVVIGLQDEKERSILKDSFDWFFQSLQYDENFMERTFNEVDSQDEFEILSQLIRMTNTRSQRKGKRIQQLAERGSNGELSVPLSSSSPLSSLNPSAWDPVLKVNSVGTLPTPQNIPLVISSASKSTDNIISSHLVTAQRDEDVVTFPGLVKMRSGINLLNGVDEEDEDSFTPNLEDASELYFDSTTPQRSIQEVDRWDGTLPDWILDRENRILDIQQQKADFQAYQKKGEELSKQLVFCHLLFFCSTIF